MPKPANLSLNLPRKGSDQKENGTRNPLSPRSPPTTNVTGTTGNNEPNGRAGQAPEGQAAGYTTFQNADQNSSTTPTSPRHRKDSSRSMFSSYKGSKSSQRLNVSENSIRQVSDSQGNASNGQVYGYRQNPGSTPELSMASNASDKGGAPPHVDSGDRHNSETNIDPDSRKGAGKTRIQTMLTRNTSTSSREREEGGRPKPKPITPTRTDSDLRGGKQNNEHAGMRTAPIEKERSFREMMSSSIRNRSVDRQPHAESEDDGRRPRKDKKDFSLSSSFKEGTGASLLSNIKNQSTRAADGLGKAGKGFFGKLTRSGSSNEREQHHHHHDENYVCRVINLPLIEQTRRTRISKRLEDSKDKTEFWMPALPWRCIDYLNMKGCEEEGLYRVPGSGREVKHWQMRFDTELDINLFDEPDLYDINIIGSMFKAWLRDLPDEILPKATQARIADQCAGAKSTPQMLKDELSKLPPFNYYLLFAITCHISLLHSCSDSNKMDYRNLCICFQPCMKIEAFCFQFLVLDWRNCWQGCWTEKEHLNEELRVMRGGSSGSQQQGASPQPQGNGPSRPPTQPQAQSQNQSQAQPQAQQQAQSQAQPPAQSQAQPQHPQGQPQAQSQAQPQAQPQAQQPAQQPAQQQAQPQIQLQPQTYAPAPTQAPPPPPASLPPSLPPSNHSNERAISSSSSNKPPATNSIPPREGSVDNSASEKHRPPPLDGERLQDDKSHQAQGNKLGPPSQLPPLAPVQPLSPLGPL